MATDEDAISCAVCCEIYSDPRSLPCGHSFCLKCIKGIADNKQMFPCPICRYNISLIDGDVNKLPKNYGLGIVIEAKDKTQSKMCSKHSKLLDIFCERCDMVICSKCLATEHKGHETEDIDKIFQERNDKLAALLAITRFWALIMQEKKDLIQQSGDSLQTKADSINLSVDKLFKKWHAALNEQQKTISSYLKKETDKKMAVCDDAEKVLMVSEAKVKELEAEINKIRSKDRIVVLQQYRYIKARHEAVGQSVIEDIETCFKPPDDLRCEVHAPWIEEAICNIKAIDITETKKSFITQKISEIQEENINLKRKHEELILEKARLEMRIEDLKLTIQGKQEELTLEKTGLAKRVDNLKLTIKGKVWKFKKDEDKEEVKTFNRRPQNQEQIDKDVDQKLQLNRDLPQMTFERLNMKEKELEDYEEREASLMASHTEK